jgi:hypothetical protein
VVPSTSPSRPFLSRRTIDHDRAISSCPECPSLLPELELLSSFPTPKTKRRQLMQIARHYKYLLVGSLLQKKLGAASFTANSIDTQKFSGQFDICFLRAKVAPFLVQQHFVPKCRPDSFLHHDDQTVPNTS